MNLGITKILFIAIFACCSINFTSKIQAAEAKIVGLKGNGEHKVDEIKLWNPATVGQDLFSGNYVRTGNYSRMAILFEDKTQIRLNNKTIIKIKPPPAQSNKNSVQIDLGRIWAQSKTIDHGRQ